MTQTILRIDASAQRETSVSRRLTDRLMTRFGGDVTVIRRDLANSLPLIDEAWVTARGARPDARDEGQKSTLSLSDELIAELRAADTIVIGLPIYNFSVPGSLKAWIDLVARPGETFRYTENGPEGLLKGKRVIVTVASGGTEIGSPIDFATGYLKFIFGFMGITDVEFLGADKLALDPQASIRNAEQTIDALDLAA